MAERIEGGFKNRVFSFLSIFIIHLKRRERVPFFYGNSLRVPNAGLAEDRKEEITTLGVTGSWF